MKIITSVDDFVSFVNSQETVPSLELKLSSNELHLDEMRVLARAIRQAENLPQGFQLDLTATDITDEGAQAIATELLNAAHLPSGFMLDLSCCRIGDKGAQALAIWLQQAIHLPQGFQLILWMNKIGTAGFQAFARAVQFARHLPQGFELNLGCNKPFATPDAPRTEIGQAIQRAREFQDLMGERIIDIQDMAAFSREFNAWYIAREREEAQRTAPDVQAFATALAQGQHLPQGFRLSLASNEINGAGITALVRALHQAQHLPQGFQLKLTDNKAEDVDDNLVINFKNLPDGFKLIGCSASLVNKMEEIAKNNIEAYEQCVKFSPGNEENIRAQFTKAQQTLKAFLAVMAPDHLVPAGFLTAEQLMGEEIRRRCVLLSASEAQDELINDIKDIINLVLSAKEPALMNNWLLTLAGMIGVFLPNNVLAHSPLQPKVINLFAFELACYAKIMTNGNGNGNTQILEIFNSLFIRFCNYLTTGISKFVSYEEVAKGVDEKTGHLSSLISKYHEAWRHILKQIVMLFQGGDTFTHKQLKFISKGDGYYEVNGQKFFLIPPTHSGYDDCCLSEGVEKKTTRRLSLSK